MDEKIRELSEKIKDRKFTFYTDGDIHVIETKGEPKRRAGWSLYDAKIGHENSSKCNMAELSELICLLLNREMERVNG